MAKLRKNGTTSRTERRREAELRKESYNSLTPKQKLDKLPPTGSNKQRAKLEHLVKFGRKVNESATPSKTKKMKDDKPSRKERWEEKQKNN
jgi:hypothetical protein|tara:strand:+ start:55 stop:327 length:273 start_codon:yes stop_codon:yes gene_type:complete